MFGLARPEATDAVNKWLGSLEERILTAKEAVQRAAGDFYTGLNLDEAAPLLKEELNSKIVSLNGRNGEANSPGSTGEERAGGQIGITGVGENLGTEGSAVTQKEDGQKSADTGKTAVEPEPSANLTAAGIVFYTNRERTANLGAGRELKRNAVLDQAAQLRLQDMFAKQYFSHESPNGLRMDYFLKKAGYDSLASAENLAQGNFSSDQELVAGWMNSPGHRANMLDGAYREIGVAAGAGMFEGRRSWIAVQLFAIPSSMCFEPDAALKVEVDGLQARLDSAKDEVWAKKPLIDAKKEEAKQLEAEISRLEGEGKSAEADSAREELGRLVSEINELVGDYNEKVTEEQNIYAEYRPKADEYNAQVKEYNLCLKGL